MDKKEIAVKYIEERSGYSKTMIRRILSLYISYLKDSLLRTNNAPMLGMGNLWIKTLKDIHHRDPRNGNKVIVDVFKVKFSVSAKFRKLINLVKRTK